MKRPIAGVVLASALASIGLEVSTVAARTWVETTSPHFVVISNGGEKTARSVAWQFEQIRQATERFWGWARVDFDKPLVIVAAADEGTLRTLAPQYWEHGGAQPAAVFVTGADRHYIALRTDAKTGDTETTNPYIVPYWSYVTLVINTAFKRDLPLWFSRGLASVMSNTIVRESHLEVGHVISWHLRRLSSAARPKLRELVSVDRQSPWYTQADRLDTFDAASWAFVHYLMFGDEGAHRAQFDRFLSLIIQGQTSAGAIEGAFGNVDALESGFEVYVNRHLFQYLRVNVDVNMKVESFATVIVSPADALATRAAFHVAMHRPQDARAAIEEARKLEANSAALSEAEGLLLDGDGKLDDAAVAYAKAVELGSKQFYAHYRLAQLRGARSQRDEAETAARGALAFAATADQRKLAQALIDANAPKPTAARTPPTENFRSGDGITMPRLLNEVKPQYTVAARDAKIAGAVLLECVIGTDGRVGDARVVRSLDRVHGLDDEAIKAVREWQFAPGTTNDGQAVPVLVTIEVTFTLK